MPSRLRSLLGKFGRLEKALLLFLLLYAVLSLATPGSVVSSVILLALVATGLAVLFRLARHGMHRLIWRLRNRLIVAYLFIAVVPILLILTMVAIVAYAVIGQMAVYLVTTELNRRAASLAGPVEALAHAAPLNREEAVNRFAPLIRSRFPEFEVLIRGGGEMRFPENSGLEPPPAEWKDASGLILRNDRIYAWSHARAAGTEVTLIAPVTHDLLTSLVPGLGEVNFLRFYDHAGLERVPPPAYTADFQVNMLYPFPLPVWESPARQRNNALIVTTRPSAVLGTVFGQRFEWGERIFGAFVAVGILFMIVEAVSLVTGIQLTRTITAAVHQLYIGTQRVKEGDFSHRISVAGNDQLAELGSSFNTMTENLGRLIVVAKEKERLQSELEIAREVQNQLFPKNAPRLRGLEITGVCNPARMVSGDYYDFISLSDATLAFAIGDVAGKGISAALLMAAIQSTMRTQLTARVPVAAGGAGTYPHVSPAEQVSQLNRQLYANTAPEKYATFFFGLYDDSSHVLTYTNGGHLPPMVLSGSGVEMLDVTGTVVGAFPVARYDEKQARLDRGDMLVAYTDGIVEPENVYGEMFGEERLKDLLLRHAQSDPAELIARTMEAVVEWTGSTELQDDMTMVIARRL